MTWRYRRQHHACGRSAWELRGRDPDLNESRATMKKGPLRGPLVVYAFWLSCAAAISWWTFSMSTSLILASSSFSWPPDKAPGCKNSRTFMEDHQRGIERITQGAGQLLLNVGVHLGERDVGAAGRGLPGTREQSHGRGHTRSPEVDDQGAVRRNGVLEAVLCEFNNTHFVILAAMHGAKAAVSEHQGVPASTSIG